MEVRLICESDIEPLIELAAHMHRCSPVYSEIPFSEAMMRGWFMAAVEKPESFFCAVARKGEELVGVMLACASPLFFSDRMLASEMGFFVYERFRGSRAALMLVKEYERWAEKLNCVFVDVSVSVGINDAHAIRFYERQGYKSCGAVLRKGGV